MKKIIILTFLLSAFFSFAAFAANRESGMTMGLSGGGYTFDSREEVNTAVAGMLRLGYDFSKYFGIEVPFELAGSTMKRTPVSENVNLVGYRLEGLVYLMPNSWFVPYIAFGAGDRNMSIQYQGTKDNFVADYGAGARMFISKNFFIRADFRQLLVFNTESGNPVNNLEYTLGLAWYLGGDKPAPKPAPVVAAPPAPPEPPKPAPAPAPVVVAPPAPAPAPVAAPTKVEKEIKEKGRATIDVKFKLNKADIIPEYDGELAKFADVLRKYPDLNVTIEGYTDNTGPASFNKTLSQKRADSVKKYLVEKLGIDAARLKAVGYGPERPVADNKTEEGRKKNRRVDASVDYWTVKKVTE